MSDRARRLLWPASIAWTATFCLIEWSLHNPFTVDDLAIRAVSMVVVPFWAGARFTARRLPVHTPGRGVDSIASAFGWFLVLFFVPALPIRYGIGFGTRYVTLIAGLAVVMVACTLGSREAFARSPGRPGRWLVQMLVTAAAGLASAIVAAWLSRGYPETRLLLAAAAFFIVSVVVCAVGDRIHP